MARVSDKLKFVGHLDICRINPALKSQQFQKFARRLLLKNGAQTLLFGHHSRNALF